MAYSLEVRQLLCEFGDGGEVVSEAIEDGLSVGLGELRESLHCSGDSRSCGCVVMESSV